MVSALWLPVVAVYFIASFGLLIYGAHCYLMMFMFLRRHRAARGTIKDEVAAYNDQRAPADYPLVTVQLPIYNESEVIERLLRSAAGIDYPRDRFEIQVLDDSTDDTRDIVDRVTAELRASGLQVQVLRRTQRTDFKAGALAVGLAQSHGDFLAIFDADFLIPPSFLRRAVALVAPHPRVACVQFRWGHTNRLENWLTRAQSIGIDGHFTAEQGARHYHGLCLNFNGTAGMWRKSAITAAGGWQGDTLTEDLDLSYRVQLNQDRIRYDFDLECPAEIPSDVISLKSQQRRWAIGSIETARKLLPTIWRDPRLPFLHKCEASLHICSYGVAVLMAVVCVLSLPMLFWFPTPHFGPLLMIAWTAILLSSVAPLVMYTGSGIVLRRGRFALLHYPVMMVLGTGLCLNNAVAVIQGLIGHKAVFDRTPKSGGMGNRPKTSRYRADTSIGLGLAEIFLGLYCVLTLIVYLHEDKMVFSGFIAAYAAGFLAFGFLTLRGKFALRPATV